MTERERFEAAMKAAGYQYGEDALDCAYAGWQAALVAQQKAEPVAWQPVPLRACIKPTHEAADAFWKYWRENGETHKHGYYESTWGAINAALACGYAAPPLDPEGIQLLREARQCVHKEANDEREIEGRGYQCYLADRIDAYLAKVQHEL